MAGRKCSVCEHPERRRIDAALVEGVSNRRIATQYGLSEAAVRRHATGHLPEHLTQAKEADTIAQADSLLEQVQDLQRRSLAILTAAEQSKDYRMALGAIRETRQTLELVAKITGELRDSTTVDVLASVEWLALREVILRALLPYPDAIAALVAALEGHHDARG